ncbi:MAG: thiamine-binding protein [Chloroflexota bacterium]
MSDPINLSIQVLPLVNDPYPVIDKAIEVIQSSGLKYEVGPMETTLEGDFETCMAVAQAVHKACFVDGVQQVVTIIKIAEKVGGTSMEGKTAKFR